MFETEAWTVRLGRQLQALSGNSTDGDYATLDHELRAAIGQIKFIRKCYNKEVSLNGPDDR